ncbi:MAG: glycosyltransferase, partial [Desulfonatronovibrio sp.]
VVAFFYGTVENMGAFYQNIEILVVPSIREPFGTVAIEAQARGCPVLCSGVDGLPEVVLDGRTGFVITPSWDIDEYLQYTAEKGNMPDRVFFPHLNGLAPPLALQPEHIALKAAQLLKDEKLFSRMSRNAVQFITENFQFEDYIRKINSVFRDPE